MFTSQFNAATAAVGMAPDVKGTLLTRVQTVLNTAVVLRKRLVKVVYAAHPRAPAEAGSARVRAHAADGVVDPWAAMMPGLNVLIDAELQQMQATADDTSRSRPWSRR